MNDPFFATMKMITSEEVLAEVMVTEEHGVTFYVLRNPIIVMENTTVDSSKGVVMSGLIPKKWLMYSDDDMTIVHTNHVVTITEMDKFGVEFYKKALLAAKVSSPIKRKIESKKHSGYLGSIKSQRDQIKRMYDNSYDIPE
tara:strand:+ start:19 stop:441 length:423 start_codon:yes stop_codon:yes gene_type:complete